MRHSGMCIGNEIDVTSADRARLKALVAARGSPQKHVWQARIILLTDDGLGTVAIMAATGKSKTCVWRWQERFMVEGVDGLLRDKLIFPRLSGPSTLLVWILRWTTNAEQEAHARSQLLVSCVRLRSCSARAGWQPRRADGSRSANRPAIAGARSRAG